MYKRVLLESSSPLSHRRARVRFEIDSVWLFLSEPALTDTALASWVLNTHRASPQEAEEQVGSVADLPPLPHQFMLEGGAVHDYDIGRLSIHWSADGHAVLVLRNGVPICFARAGDARGHARFVGKSGLTWAAHWDEVKLRELFGDLPVPLVDAAHPRVMLDVPEEELPAEYRMFFQSPSAVEAESPYRLAQNRFYSEQVKFFPVEGPWRMTWVGGCGGFLFVVSILPILPLLLSFYDRSQHAFFALVALLEAAVLILTALLGLILILRDRFKKRPMPELDGGGWPYGLFLFPDACVVRRRTPGGCCLFPKTAIVGFVVRRNRPGALLLEPSGKQGVVTLPRPCDISGNWMDLGSFLEKVQTWR